MTNSDDSLCLLTEERSVLFEFFLDGVAVAAMPGESVLAACQRTGVRWRPSARAVASAVLAG
ncbi:MAG: 2Fe-2S iron-sulfur cluster-binding protein [Methylovirgula sp.]